MTNPAAPRGTADDRDDEQRDEWSRFVAVVPIDFYGQRAYNVGDPVPISAVVGEVAWIDERWVDERPAFEGSATVPPPEQPAIDPTAAAAPPAATPDPGSIVTSTED